MKQITLAFFLFLSFYHVIGQSNKQDSLALVDLYNSTNGANWNNNTGWLQSSVCNWYGVTLDSTGKVTSLLLNSNNLSGSIPNSLGNLSKLNTLDLSNNQLSENVPISLGLLRNLTYLDVSSNSFLFGDLEPILKKLEGNNNVTFIDSPQNTILSIYQSGNKLYVSAGGTPRKISYSWYVNGYLFDTISGDSSIIYTGGTYTVDAYDSILGQGISSNSYDVQIKTNTNDSSALVDLYNSTVNQYSSAEFYYWLSGPVCFWPGVLLDTSGRVTSITLSYFNPSGKLPNSLGNLTKLTSLDVSTGHMTGNIPVSLALLPNLKNLNVSNNSFVFGDLEPIAQKLNGNKKVSFSYSNQANIPLYQSGNSLIVTLGGTLKKITYSWFMYVNNSWDSITSKTGDSSYMPTNPNAPYYVVAYDSLLNLSITSDNAISPFPLPVSIGSFIAKENDGSAILNWQTSTELNADNFIIQHSTDGSSFTEIGTIKAIGSGANSYNFTDNNPANGINYYRLESVDKDGAVSYSKIVSASITNYELPITVFPNPACTSITLKGSHINTVQLNDNMGKVVKIVALKDATNPALSVGGIGKGLYHLRVQSTDGRVNTVEFIKE